MTPLDPVPEPTLAELREQLTDLAQGAQDKGKARFVLAISAVLNLSKTKSLWSRKELLKPPFDIGVEVPKAMEKEIASKSWFTGFVNRLVGRKLIEQDRGGHEITYYSETPEQRDQLLVIAAEALYGGGRTLKALIWPNDDTYAEPVEFPEDEGSEDAPGTDEDQALNTITELTGQLSLVAATLEGVVQGFTALDQKWSAKFEELGTLATWIREELGSMATMNASLNDLIQTIKSERQSERRAQLSGILTRFVEMQTRNNSLANQFESEQSKRERLVEDLRKMLENP